MDPCIRGVDDDAVRCGPGRRFASLVSPLRAGPSRVVPMPAAGIKGSEGLHADRRAGQSQIPTVTSPSVSIAAGESTKQAEKTTACGTPDECSASVVTMLVCF